MSLYKCLATLSTLLAFNSCGTDKKENNENQKLAAALEPSVEMPLPQANKSLPQISFLIDDVSKLPTCDASHQGALAYVKATLKFMTCQSENWITIEIKGEQGVRGDKGEPGIIPVSTPTPQPIPAPAEETYFTLRLSYFVGYYVQQNVPLVLTRNTKSIVLPLKGGKIAMAKLSCSLRQIDDLLYECEYKDSPFNNKPCEMYPDPTARENRDIFSFNYENSKKEISAQIQNGRSNQDRPEIINEFDRMRDYCVHYNSTGHPDTVVNP